MCRFSIITPQYNSFDLMNRYFDSFENQTFKDFELIIIDDCSTDHSYEKLKDYVGNTILTVKLLQTKKNQGPGNARNVGIESASGDWITFVDNDDWVTADFLEQINKVIDSQETNCVIYDYYMWLDGKIKIARSMYTDHPGKLTVSDCIVATRNHVIGKFYKLSECKNVRFPNVKRCEDVAFVTQAIAACGNAFYYNVPLYYYRQRPTSLSNNSKMDHTDMVKAFSILEEKFNKDYPLEIKNKSVTDILYGGLLMMCKSGKKREEILQYLKEYENRYPKWWNCQIINYLGAEKRVFLLCARWRFVLGLKAIAFVHSVMIKKGA